MQDENALIKALNSTQLYHDFDLAFAKLTELPLALEPADPLQLPHQEHHRENWLCALMAAKSTSCAECSQVQNTLLQAAQHQAQSVACRAGLYDIAVPVHVGEKLVGYLRTGHIFREKPTATNFNHFAEFADGWGVGADSAELRKGYFDTRTFSDKDYAAVVLLLQVFSKHLSLIGNQILLQRENAEPPVIANAKKFIKLHLDEDLSLEQVAKSSHMSIFYFCKMFKKCVGINFTDYVSLARIENAKSLLLNPNLRVSEIAFEVGFQSLTQFNRVFKKTVGQSPTEYRAALPDPA